MLLARSGLTLVLGLAALLAATPAAAEPPADKEKQAVTLHDEAWSLYEQGRYRAAIDKLDAALRIDPHGVELVYNLALLHEKLGELPEAIGFYRRYVEMETEPRAREKAQATLKRLEGAEREATERGIPPRGPVAVPGAPLRDPPPDHPSPLRLWAAGVGIAAGAALVVGVATGLSALVKNPGSDARTGHGVTIADLERDARMAHSEAVAADVSFIFAAGAASVALILYLTAPRAVSSGGLLDPRRVAVGPGQLRVSF